jgi:hypothetical protein
MKVRCIRDVRFDNQVCFRKNQWYESEITSRIGSEGLIYRIKSDLNIYFSFFNISQQNENLNVRYLFIDYFQTSEEYREIKLLELGI